MRPMTSRQRLLTALRGGKPDRLPATTHHLMAYFLTVYMGGMSEQDFFEHFGLDAILWLAPVKPDTAKGEYFDPLQGELPPRKSRRILSASWRLEVEDIPSQEYATTRYRFVTPKGTLTMVTQANQYTAWASETLVKEKRDIDLIAEYCTNPRCDVDVVNSLAEEFGERGIVRGSIVGFDVHGQGGCWQDACCLVGTERLILATYDDPQWVHELLRIMLRRKRVYIESLQGARYDILELGGGDASSTVISPRLFDEFVAPYDAELIALAHEVGQRIVYHTCGGMMPILERIADLGTDAMETFTPAEMGGDVDLAEAKRRIGSRVCMIGGFDQFHYFWECTPEQTRTAVRACFAAAGADGGYILCPSDHFFDADPSLIQAYADEARRCVYEETRS